MDYPSNKSFDKLNQEIDQDSLAENNSLQTNFYDLNEPGTIGFGIPNTLEFTYIVNYCLGVILVIIGLAGSAGNGLVLYVFTRYRRLRGGGGPLIRSLASGDLLVSMLHILPAVSSFNNKWVFGNTGCSLYAASVGLCGIASLLTLSAIAADRFSVIIGCPLVWLAGIKTCVAIWLMSAALTFPPLFGWSRYGLEGLGTSCSWDYVSRDFHNRLYYIFLLSAGFVLPVSIITSSYLGILWVVCKQKSQLIAVYKGGTPVSYKKPTKNDMKTAQVICTIIIFFLVAWTPYAIVSLIGQFGDESRPLSPMVTALPAIFAKTSVIINPIVYGLSHPHFRSALRTLRTRGFGGKKYRNESNGNKAYYPYYQYNCNQSKYTNRYPSATRLNELYNGSRHGGGERLRRETSRQREMWNHQYSGSTRMMSDMTTICQSNRSNTNMLVVVQNTSLLQKHLVFVKNGEHVRVKSISNCCNDRNVSQEQIGNSESNGSTNSSSHRMSTPTKKHVHNSNIVFKEKRRYEFRTCCQGQKLFSRSENCLSIAQCFVREPNYSIRCDRRFSTSEHFRTHIRVENNIRCYEHIHYHSKIKYSYRNGANQRFSSSTDDCLRKIPDSEPETGVPKSWKKNCYHLYPKKITYKRKLLNFRGNNVTAGGRQTQNKWSAFSFNREELSKNRTGLYQDLPLQKPVSACLYGDKCRSDFVLHKLGERDPMSVVFLKNNTKKSTLSSLKHKFLESSCLAKKILRGHDEKQVFSYSNASVTSNSDYLTAVNHIPEYCSSFI